MYIYLVQFDELIKDRMAGQRVFCTDTPGEETSADSVAEYWTTSWAGQTPVAEKVEKFRREGTSFVIDTVWPYEATKEIENGN